MPICITQEEYLSNPDLYEVISGPHEGACDPSCSASLEGLAPEVTRFIDVSKPVLRFSGSQGGSFVVPEGFDYLVRLGSGGSFAGDEFVIPGQSVSLSGSGLAAMDGMFDWLLGSVTGAIDSLVQGTVDILTPCEGGKSRGLLVDFDGFHGVAPCGCYTSATDFLLTLVGGAATLRSMLVRQANKKRLALLVQGIKNSQQEFRRNVRSVLDRVDQLNDRINELRNSNLSELWEVDDYELFVTNAELLQDVLANKFTRLSEIAGLDADEIANLTNLEDVDDIFDYVGAESDILEIANQLDNFENFVRDYQALLEDSVNGDEIRNLKNEVRALKPLVDWAGPIVDAGFTLLAVLSNLDIVMYKACNENELCGTKAELDTETCECSVCPPGYQVCPAWSISDDFYNSCVPNCEAGSVFAQSTVTGRCYCECAEGTTFKACDSGYNPLIVCGDRGEEGECVNESAYDVAQFEWDPSICNFRCRALSVDDASGAQRSGIAKQVDGIWICEYDAECYVGCNSPGQFQLETITLTGQEVSGFNCSDRSVPGEARANSVAGLPDCDCPPVIDGMGRRVEYELDDNGNCVTKQYFCQS
jgi:hypothetical protein